MNLRVGAVALLYSGRNGGRGIRSLSFVQKHRSSSTVLNGVVNPIKKQNISISRTINSNFENSIFQTVYPKSSLISFAKKNFTSMCCSKPSSNNECPSYSLSAVSVGSKAPTFNKVTAVMPDGSFKEVSLEDYLGKKYVFLFFYPLDFTFVCPSEIIAFSKKISEFESRDVQVLGCSVDSHFTHYAWRNTEPKDGGIGQISYPLLSDLDKSIASMYGILLPGGMSLRGNFLIDKNGVLQHALVNNLSLGRDVDETLRIVDALQFTEKHGEVCPANWSKGKSGMKPDAAGVASYLKENA